MKFKLDENLPVSSAAILTSVGHDVDTVAEEGLVGAPDRDVVPVWRISACRESPGGANLICYGTSSQT